MIQYGPFIFAGGFVIGRLLRTMPIGTKSLLFGVHQIFIHPWFVALAWWKLYGFPYDPRLWVAFIVHDWGYWGCPNMDGPEGEWHPATGAKIMGWLFDVDAGVTSQSWFNQSVGRWIERLLGRGITDRPFQGLPNSWYQFAFYHSRFLAKKYGVVPSKLCMADKLSFAVTPPWVYLPLVRMTGEWREYAAAHAHEKANPDMTLHGWYYQSRAFVRRWVEEHKDGREDTWTQPKPSASPSPAAERGER